MSSAQSHNQNSSAAFSSNQTVANAQGQVVQQQGPDSRLPTANVNENPDAVPRTTPGFDKGDEVWVWKEVDAEYVKATVVMSRYFGNDWRYHLKDGDGLTLWREKETWVEEAQLTLINRA